MKINSLNVTLTKEQVNALYSFLSKTSLADRINAVESDEWSEAVDAHLLEIWYEIRSLVQEAH